MCMCVMGFFLRALLSIEESKLYLQTPILCFSDCTYVVLGLPDKNHPTVMC